MYCTSKLGTVRTLRYDNYAPNYVLSTVSMHTVFSVAYPSPLDYILRQLGGPSSRCQFLGVLYLLPLSLYVCSSGANPRSWPDGSHNESGNSMPSCEEYPDFLTIQQGQGMGDSPVRMTAHFIMLRESMF